jgi:hypothetical protein
MKSNTEVAMTFVHFLIGYPKIADEIAGMQTLLSAGFSILAPSYTALSSVFSMALARRAFSF